MTTDRECIVMPLHLIYWQSRLSNKFVSVYKATKTCFFNFPNVCPWCKLRILAYFVVFGWFKQTHTVNIYSMHFLTESLSVHLLWWIPEKWHQTSGALYTTAERHYAENRKHRRQTSFVLPLFRQTVHTHNHPFTRFWRSQLVNAYLNYVYSHNDHVILWTQPNLTLWPTSQYESNNKVIIKIIIISSSILT